MPFSTNAREIHSPMTISHSIIDQPSELNVLKILTFLKLIGPWTLFQKTFDGFFNPYRRVQLACDWLSGERVQLPIFLNVFFDGGSFICLPGISHHRVFHEIKCDPAA